MAHTQTHTNIHTFARDIDEVGGQKSAIFSFHFHSGLLAYKFRCAHSHTLIFISCLILFSRVLCKVFLSSLLFSFTWHPPWNTAKYIRKNWMFIKRHIHLHARIYERSRSYLRYINAHTHMPIAHTRYSHRNDPRIHIYSSYIRNIFTKTSTLYLLRK